MITLYDIPGTCPGKAWSPNTWKIRYTLAFKGIPFKTEWVEYPDIESVAKKIGARHTEYTRDGKPRYTVPFIHDSSNDAVIADSADIAVYLETTYSDAPKVFPPGTFVLQQTFEDGWSDRLQGLWPMLIPAAHSILNPRSQEYFRRTREQSEKFKGLKLEEWCPPGEKRVRSWASTKEGFDWLDKWFTSAGYNRGKYVMGDTPSYADIVICSYLQWMYTCFGAESPEWKDVSVWHEGRWAEHLKLFKEYEILD